MIEYQLRPYRPCIGIVLVNHSRKIFVGQRIDNAVEAWQMPQGGIDDGEEPLEAGLREMLEEIGTNDVRLIAEHPSWLDYDIPQNLADQLWNGVYRGQTQKWMLFQFLGRDDDINIETSEPEFRTWRWAEPDILPELAVSFKKDIYKNVLETFKGNF